MTRYLQQNGISQEDREDIVELRDRIQLLAQGEEDEERFRHYRLTRGVYGQRQHGVQMFRIKIPYGKLTTDQLIRIADISERYTNGNLHLTTRQNIQLHYVKLEDSPAIWTELAEKGITAREACGNTVRNITGSAKAGIDPDEPFDISPYVQATFEYFLRNPICQDMGRKIKIAFSSSEKDSAYTYFHDFGFIPRVQEVDGREKRGFKVVIGGGLGAVSMVAQTVYEFLGEDEIIPFLEAGIRVFDRFGEREKRMKARMKFLIKEIGLSGFVGQVKQEWPALRYQRYPIETAAEEPLPCLPSAHPIPKGDEAYRRWLRTNVFEQKQAGWYAAQLRVPLGNIDAETARKLAGLTRQYAADDIRVTVNQGLLLRNIRPQDLMELYRGLEGMNLASPGFDTTVDITACPGTDTCALGVTNSTGLASQLEEVIREEYPALVEESGIRIKISGCMNSCGQHMAANIGFHGSSIKKRPLVVPAMQVVLGGGVDETGKGFVAEKVIKLPTRRIPDALRLLLNDYEYQGAPGEYFNDYFRRQTKAYFYDLLKPLAELGESMDELTVDWGQSGKYVQSIGVGECAGVSLDLVSTITGDARDKLRAAKLRFEEKEWSHSIYNSYTAMVIGAKALLLSEDQKCNTHRRILRDFQGHFVATGKLSWEGDFEAQVLAMHAQPPQGEFAKSCLALATDFLELVAQTRQAQLKAEGGDKAVLSNYYKA